MPDAFPLKLFKKLIRSIKKRAKLLSAAFLLAKQILQIIAWRFTGARFVVINESAGLGDYLWVRGYLKIIREQTNYKIVFCATERWRSFARIHDGENIDMLISFEDPTKPRTIETFIFKFFVAELFIDLRAYTPVHKSIRYKEKIEPLDGFGATYDTRDELFKTLVKIPETFAHSLKCIPIRGSLPPKPYCILVPAGYHEGGFSEKQLLSMTRTLIAHGIFVLMLGIKRDLDSYSYVLKNLDGAEKNKLVNGCAIYKEYELPTIINNSLFIITPNTSIYNMALQLNKQIILVDRKVFNGASRYDDKASICLRPLENDLPSLRDFPIEQIVEAIEQKFTLCRGAFTAF